MNKVSLVLMAAVMLTGCETEVNDPVDTNEPTDTSGPIDSSYSIEGKWLWSPTVNVEDANTMYEFVEGLRYTYYADCSTPCDEDDWNALDSSDRIPGVDSYTFENDTLTINNSDVPLAVTFDCEKVYFGDWHLWRLNADCE